MSSRRRKSGKQTTGQQIVLQEPPKIESADVVIAQYEKQVFDLQQMIEISRSLCTTLELSSLIESILYITMAQMRVLGAGIFVKESIEREEFDLGRNYNGLDVDITKEYKFPLNCPMAEKMLTMGKAFTISSLKEVVGESKEIELLESLQPSLIVPLVLKNHLSGVLILGERIALDSSMVEYNDYEKNEISTIASLAAIAVNNASLVEQSSTDMMTRLKLKYYFFNILTDKIDMALSQNSPLSVIMFDIDFFKKFNDTYGHACGDYVLQTVAKLIRSNIRTEDMASRYGGEEFTVMLCDTGKEEAMVVAERIRSAIENNDFFFEGQHMKVTISGGLSVLDTENNPVTSTKVFVDQADQALYVSKRNGRNQITFASPELLKKSSDNE